MFHYFIILTDKYFHLDTQFYSHGFPSLQFTLRQSGILNLSWFLLGVWINRTRPINFPRLDYGMGVVLILISCWDAIGGNQGLKNHTLLISKLAFYILILALMFLSIKKNGLFKLRFSKQNYLVKLGNVSYE